MLRSGCRDSNPGPPEPHSGTLPDCATPRVMRSIRKCMCSTAMESLSPSGARLQRRRRRSPDRYARQRDMERAPALAIALRPYAPAVAVHDLLADVEAKPPPRL